MLGHDLGPANLIGPAMTRKVLKRNGQTVYLLFDCSLVDARQIGGRVDEETKCEDFTEKANSVLGDGYKCEDFATNPELVDLETPPNILELR